MQLSFRSLLRLPVRPFSVFSPSRRLLALSTVFSLSLTACGVSYTPNRQGGESASGQEESSIADLSGGTGAEKGQVTVDNADAGFRLYVEPGYHQLDRAVDAWTHTAVDQAPGGDGVGSDFLAAPTGYLGQAAGSESPNGLRVAAIALWEAELTSEPTDYAIYAYIVPSPQNSQYASYCFSKGTNDDDQETQDCGLVDQSTGTAGWRLLTTLPLLGKSQVWLDPGATLEPGKRVVADAVKFVPTPAS